MSEATLTSEKLLKILSRLNKARNAKVLQSLVNQSYRNANFIGLLLQMINRIDYPHIMGHFNVDLMPTMKNCAIVLNRCLKKQFQDDNFEVQLQATTRYFFDLLLNWKLPFQIKKLLIDSFTACLSRWSNQLDQFFEKVMDVLIKMMDIDLTKMSASQELHEEIEYRNKESKFHIQVIIPQYTNQVYHIIIFIAEALFQQFKLKTGAYQYKIIQKIKKVHQQLFKEGYIERFFSVFEHLFLFWQNFNYNGTDVPKQLKPAYLYISDWHSFSNDIEMVMNYQAVSCMGRENIYNYLVLTSENEQLSIIQLKCSALQTYNEMLSIEQVFLQSRFNDSSICLCLNNISNSILYSLRCCLQSEARINEQTRQFQICMLNTLSIYFHQFQLDLKSYSQIILQIILPLISVCLKEYQHQLSQTNIATKLLEILNDCADCQHIDDMLPFSCKCLQTIADSNQSAYQLIFNFVFYSIATKFNFINRTDMEQTFRVQPLELGPSLLILNILSYKDTMRQYQYLLMKQFFVEQIFCSLTEYEKMLCYFYLSYNWAQLFQHCEQESSFLFKYCFSSKKIQVFALDFANNICQDHFEEQLMYVLVQRIMDIKNEDELQNTIFQILSKTIKYHLSKISEQNIAKLIQLLTFSTLSAVKRIQKSLAKNQLNYDKYAPIIRLNLCRQISKDHEYIQNKPLVRSQLFKILDHINAFNSVLIDDQAIWIGGELLEASQHLRIKLPQKFDQILKNISRTFSNSQYSGMSYYYFFGQSIEAINDDNIDESRQNIIVQLYDILIEGFAYLVQFPQQQLNNEQFQALAAHEILLQNIFFLYGDQLDPRFINETKEMCNQLLLRIPTANQYILQSRTQNLILLCNILLRNKTYNIQEIYSLANNSYYFNNEDSLFLIFLLNKIRPKLPPNQQYQVATIVLLVVKSIKTLKKSKFMVIFQQLRKQNNILNYVLRPYQAEATPLQQARKFFTDYQAQEAQNYYQVCKQLQKSALSEQFSRVKNKRIQEIPTINIVLNEDSQELEKISNNQQSQKNASLSQQMISKRKIVTIVKDRIPTQSSEIVLQPPKDLKRCLQRSCQNQQFEKSMKRRKLDEFIVIPEAQKTKRQIVLQKMIKKANRY